MRSKRWLELAVSDQEYEYAEPLIGDGYAISTDGYRVHIAKLDRVPEPEETSGIVIGRLQATRANAEKRFEMFVDPAFLMDALEGFDCQTGVKLECFSVEESGQEHKTFIRIIGTNEHEAWIMGRWESGESNELKEAKSLVEKTKQKRKCERKQRYQSKAAALKALGWHVRRYQPVATVKAYKCKYCDGWHIGHNKAKFYRRYVR